MAAGIIRNELLTRIDELGLLSLRNKANLLDEITKKKFIDEFAGASDDALVILNNNTALIDYWKINGALIKNRVYPNAPYKSWDDAKNAILGDLNPVEMKILNAIENAPLPHPDAEKVMAGAYSPDLSNSQVVIRYNTNGFDASILEPELRQHLEYLNLIKLDFEKKGKLFEKLYTGVPANKMLTANAPGMHAEVLATNEIIKLLKLENKFTGIQDLNKIHVLVKGKVSSRGFQNMCRCPHCFQIINGVKVIGNQ